jgi:hypothetical protein
MNSAVKLLPVLTGTINHISQMVFSAPGTTPIDAVSDSATSTSEAMSQQQRLKNLQKVRFLYVRRNERRKRAVLSRREKFHIVKAEMEPITKALQRTSSAKFYSRVAQLHATLEALMASWNEEEQATEDTDVGASDDDSAACGGYFSTYCFGAADNDRDPADENDCVEHEKDSAGIIVASVVRRLVDLVELEAAQEVNTLSLTAATLSNIPSSNIPSSNVPCTSTMTTSSNVASTLEDEAMPEDMEDHGSNGVNLEGLNDIPVTSIIEVPASQVTLPDLAASQLSLPDLQERLSNIEETRLADHDVPAAVLATRARHAEMDALNAYLHRPRTDSPPVLSLPATPGQETIKGQLFRRKMPPVVTGNVRDGGNVACAVDLFYSLIVYCDVCLQENQRRS